MPASLHCYPGETEQRNQCSICRLYSHYPRQRGKNKPKLAFSIWLGMKRHLCASESPEDYEIQIFSSTMQNPIQQVWWDPRLCIFNNNEILML